MQYRCLIAAILVGVGCGYAQTPMKTEIVKLSGTEIYYAVYGTGEPLFLLHGFTATSQSWLPFVDDYASDYQVYLVDLKGHGKSGPFTEPLSIKAAAEDLQALLAYLNIDRIKAIGFSYGGDVLFQLALLQPDLITAMICIGATGTWRIDDLPEWLAYLSYDNIDHLPWMREQQESEARIQSILDQVPNYNVSLSDQELHMIRTKTLLVIGDQDDSIPMEEIIRAKQQLPFSWLWIVPNSGHIAYKGNNKERFVAISKDFLEGTDWVR